MASQTWITAPTSRSSFLFTSKTLAASSLLPKNPCHSSHHPLTRSLSLSLRSRSLAPVRCFASALTPQLKSTLDNVVTSNKVVLFMKGTKDFPQCGFSHTVVQILNSLNVPFEYVNILENEMLRQGLKEYSSWPTFPQLYIGGEFFGGCDITVDNFSRFVKQKKNMQEGCEKSIYFLCAGDDKIFSI